MIRLNERTINLGKEYTDFFYNKDGIEEWGDEKFETLEGGREVFKLAKNKTKGKSTKESEKAILYLYKIVKKMAMKYFWVFLGPNTKSQQQRIANGDDYEYFSMCTEALYDALKTFKPSKATTVAELKSGFQFYFRGYIKAATIKVNKERDNHGLNGYGADSNNDIQVINPDSYDVEGSKSAWDNLDYSTDDFTKKFETEDDDNDEFKAAWKELAQDKALHVKGKHWNEILAEILKGNSVENIAVEFGVAKNTVREKFFTTKHNRENGNDGLLDVLMKKYHINMMDLADNLGKNLSFMVNTLKEE